MKIVLTNDDGIEAPGLQMLYNCLKDSGQVVIVAPQQQQSGIAHRITTRTPIEVKKAGRNRFGVDGTPAYLLGLETAYPALALSIGTLIVVSLATPAQGDEEFAALYSGASRTS